MMNPFLHAMAWLFALSFLTPSYAQRYPLDNRRDYTWLFGYGNTPPLNSIFTMQFDDNGAFTSSYAGHDLQVAEGSSIISDVNGNLEMFTNGNALYNRNYQRPTGNMLLANRSSLIPADYLGQRLRQSSLVLPWPDRPNKKFIIYTNTDYITTPRYGRNSWIRWLLSAEWDNNLDNGRGNVVYGDSLVLQDTFNAGHIAACRHANGRDWWIIAMREESDVVHRLLLDPDGIHYLGTQRTGARLKILGLGSTRFSPDGTRLVQTGTWDFSEGYFATYDFDRCSGYLSNCRDTFWVDTLPRGGVSVGGDWSPDGNYYYMSTTWRILQLNMNDPAPFNSSIVVQTWDGVQSPTNNGNPNPVFGGGCRAPDGKLYFDAVNTEYLHVIDYPNEAGAACGVRQRGITMPCWNSLFIPYFPNFRLGPLDGSACDTLGIDVVSGTPSPEGEQYGIRAFPNPTGGVVNFELPDGMMLSELRVYDTVGRLVLRKVEGIEASLDLSGLVNGVYFVELRSEVSFLSEGSEVVKRVKVLKQ